MILSEKEYAQQVSRLLEEFYFQSLFLQVVASENGADFE